MLLKDKQSSADKNMTSIGAGKYITHTIETTFYSIPSERVSHGNVSHSWLTPSITQAVDNRCWLHTIPLLLETEYSVLCGQYHARWCPGSLSRQGISRHGIASIG